MKKEKNLLNKLTILVLALTLLLVGFNSYQIQQLTTPTTMMAGTTTQLAAGPGGVIPTGVPEVYGAELAVSYDDVSAQDPRKADATIRTLAQIDRSVELSGADLERYVNILYHLENGMSCEYCCGARSIIFADGKAACGCAHSYAMRGLTKYLITEHGAEYSDEEILAEVGKWKVLFFPTQLQQKALILESQGIETNYVNLASNKYRGIEKGTAGGGMVGGC